MLRGATTLTFYQAYASIFIRLKTNIRKGKQKMSGHEQAPQISPQEAFRGVTRQQAIQEFSGAIIDAALGSTGEGTTPIRTETHTFKLDKAQVGDYKTAAYEATRFSNRNSGVAGNTLEIIQSGNDGEIGKGISREISVDPNTGKAYEDRFGPGRGRERGTPSTRRIMAATRLTRHKFGVNEEERKAA
jgi:hypothetical protein